MRLIDTHAHLQSERFAHDAAEVLAAARAAGVERLLAPGWDRRSSERSLALAARHGVDASSGIHPHLAGEATAADRASVAALAADDRVVAVGETGLDYDRGFSPREAQLDNLRWHLALGRRVGKPVILHCRSAPDRRDAQDDLIRELTDAGIADREWRERLGRRPPAVLHSFSGPVDYGEMALELGLAISFSGLVFRSTEAASAAVARLVPTDRLLVETDAPYLKPRGIRGSRNEPRHVAVTARWVAAERGEEPEVLGEGLVATYDAVFRSSLAPGT